MSADSIQVAAKPIYDERDTDILLYSGGLWHPSDDWLIDRIGERRCRSNLLLMLTTTGGWPGAAYRICRCLQEKYRNGRLAIFVADECTSAGTLLALGADDLIMSDAARFGPLDTQLRSREESGELVSGLTATQALATLKSEAFKVFDDYFRRMRHQPGLSFSTRVAAQMASEMTIGLFKPIYEQVDPMRLGENERAIQLAKYYGSRLATDNLKEDTLARLIAGYPAHDFIIDRWEAAQLFNRVRTPDEAEAKLAEEVEELAEEGRENDRHGRDPKIEFISPEPSGAKDDKKGEEPNDRDTDRTNTEGAREAESGSRGGPGGGRPVSSCKDDRGQPATASRTHEPIRQA